MPLAGLADLPLAGGPVLVLRESSKEAVAGLWSAGYWEDMTGATKLSDKWRWFRGGQSLEKACGRTLEGSVVVGVLGGRRRLRA